MRSGGTVDTKVVGGFGLNDGSEEGQQDEGGQYK